MSTSTYQRLAEDAGSEDELLRNSINAQTIEYVPNESRTEDTIVKVYTRRWYLLFVFCLMVAVQAAIYNTWSPISNSAEVVFGWNDSNIALLSNWAPITALIVMTGFSWLIDKYGIRVTAVLSTILMTLGSGLRCITQRPPAATMLINAGHILNGVAGVMGGAGCTLLSAVWFPPYQRATATAIALNSFNLGISASFIAGPLLVSEIGNMSRHIPAGYALMSEENMRQLDHNTTVPTIKNVTDEIMRLMYYECGLAGLVLILVVAYFPARPPTPPSASASSDRTDFKRGFIALLSMKNFWIVAISYSVSMGVGNAFNGVIDVNLKSFNIHQKDAGWLGVYALIAGTVSAILTARFSDRYTGHMKTIIVVFLLLAGLLGTWSVLLLARIIPFSIYELYASSILLSVFENGAAPLFFELACETSYPVAEGVTVGLLAFCGNFVAILFLLIMMIPGIGTIWMNWCLLGSCFFCFALMLFYKGSYRRLELDSEIIVNADA